MEEAKSLSEGVEERKALRTSDALMASGITAAHGFEHMYGQAFYSITAKIEEALLLSNWQVSMMDAVRSISSGLTSMGGGFFSDIFQHRRAQILAFSMLLIGLGYLLVAVSPTYGLILVFLLLPSAGSALWHPPALGLVSQRFPAHRGLLISLHRSCGSVGDTVGPLIAGALLAYLSWRWILGGGTPMLLLLSVLIFIFLRNWVKGPRPQEATFGRNTKAQFHSLKEAFKGGGLRAILPIFAVSAVDGMGSRALRWMIPVYIADQLGKSDLEVGYHVALMAALGIVSAPLFGSLSDRIGRKPLVVLTTSTSAIVILMMVLSGSGIGFTLSVAAFGLFASSLNSLTQAAAMDMAEGRRLEGTFIGLMWGVNAFFGAATAIVAGVLADLVGREAVFYLSSSLFAVGFLTSLTMPSTRPRRPLASSGEVST